MIRITFKTEPYWLDLPLGLRALVRPAGTSVLVAAGADLGEDRGRVSFARAVARAAILEWEGVVGADDKPLPVTPEAIDEVMEVWAVFTAFERLYVQPALMVSTEGNA